MTPSEMEPRQTRVAALRARRQVTYLMIMVVITALISAGISIAYTKRTAVSTEQKARSDIQRWCVLLTSIDTRYQKLQPPPETATQAEKLQYADAVEFKDQIHDLWTAYDCANVRVK